MLPELDRLLPQQSDTYDFDVHGITESDKFPSQFTVRVFTEHGTQDFVTNIAGE